MKKLNKELLCRNIEKAAMFDFENNKVFGSAYCVIQDGKEIYNNCFGYTGPDTDIPVTENTLFRLASMTKPITAIAALILVDRGLLSLYDPVSKYIPEFEDIHIKTVDSSGNLKDLGKPKKQVKIINLLSHVSGVGSNPEKLDKMTDSDRQNTENYVNFLLDSGLDFEPETEERYSGTGAFQVLVKIIEMLSGTDFFSFLKKEIFEPCGMTDTVFIPTKEQWERLIPMHIKLNGESKIAPQPENCVFRNFPCTHCLGGAGLISSIKDYTKFALMLLNKSKTSAGQLVSDETFKLLHTPHVPHEVMPRLQRWGLGVRVIVDEAYTYLPVGAFGWSGAFGSHFWIDPENKIAAVFMKNSLYDGGSENESALNFEKAVHASLEEI